VHVQIVAAAQALGDSDDKNLFRVLRVRRSALARRKRVPAYAVLPDKNLIDMARRRPASLAEMAEVHGVGEVKLARYGQEFLDVIRQHQEGE
jgi:ATP-dependent DNA helicase RecQ